MKWVVAIACLALAVAGFWWWTARASRINTWEMVNTPPKPGAVLCFGDSLVAGVGAETAEQRFPACLGRTLPRQVHAIGTPGQTTGEALDAIREKPELAAPIVIVTLGGNDILKQVRWSQTEQNLAAIFEAFQARGAFVVFTGVEGPISGSRGGRYRELCRTHGVLLVPDILDDILGNQDLMSDSVHPNGDGYRIVAERIATILTPWLSSEEGKSNDEHN